MKPPYHGHKMFHGTTTLGEKGQVVIPADARKAMGLKTGDKLLVFSMGKNMVALSKFEQLEAMAEKMSQKLQSLRDILKNA